MADTKTSALPADSTVASTDQILIVPSGGQTSKATASQLRQYIGAGLSNAAAATVSAGYAADTYLAGSAITIPVAGGWKAGTIYICNFDIVKTAAGVAAFTITVRMGTLGTTGDASVLSLAFAAGTGAADSGRISVEITFRTVGGATSAVIEGLATMQKLLTTTGLVNSGANIAFAGASASAGFNSTTQTIIGLSINGGASFSGTNNLVQAYALNI